MPDNFQDGKRNLCDCIYVKVHEIIIYFFSQKSKCVHLAPQLM